MDTKRYSAALCAALLAAGLSGCGPSVRAWDTGTAQTAADPPEVTSLAAFSEGGGEGEAAERFRPYEPFGLTYDAEKNELWFGGERVRWFEDYYPLSQDGEQAGNDFFSEGGTVDVHAVRDRSALVRRADGSYDPSGTLTGVEAFPEEEFAARDIEALRNPTPVTAAAGDGEWSEAAIAAEYEPFGVTYDAGKSQWYYNGEKVCYLRDVLTSNGKSLTGGGFRGAMRTLSSAEGTLRIETIRDFTRPDAQGFGTLTGIRALENNT